MLMQTGCGVSTCCPVAVSLPRLFVDSIGDDVVRILIGGEQEPSGGIEGEVPRKLAAGGLVVHDRERTRVRVDFKNHDAVVPPVGAVDKAPIGRHVDVRTIAGIGKTLRQRGNHLDRLQDPLRSSYAYATAVLSSSLIRYACFRFGWNAKCLGPAPA